uniref:Capsid and scaffold protein n=1 Tax=Caulobacter phage BL57 TaxID=3348355 RepID=A0AB74UM91_9VIRU
MPVLSYDTLDLVPEGLREYAKQVDGSDKFQVNVVSANKIDEFRDNNIKISKERDSLLAEVETLRPLVGEDPAAFAAQLEELRSIAQRVKDGDLKEGRALEEALQKRTEEMRKQYDERLQATGKERAAWQSKHDELERRYKQSLVSNAITAAAMAQGSGVDPAALNDVVRSGLDVFRADDQGRLTPYVGDAPLYGADGVTPMTAKEWLAKLKEEKPYFFLDSRGGGAGGDKTKTVHGHTAERLKGMSAAERLAAANGEKSARLR